MGITLLEENYQHIKDVYSLLTPHLIDYAERASFIQNEMRNIFNHITPHLCTDCENKCCEGFPLDGWFSLEDYVLFRVKYAKPLPPHNRINHPSACAFVTPHGCSLPEDLRPFTCVKINCSKVTEVIIERGEEQHFNQLSKALDAIHRDVSSMIKQHRESYRSCRPTYEKDTNLFYNF